MIPVAFSSACSDRKPVGHTFLLVFLIFPFIINAQRGITFEIENLSKPKDLLNLSTLENIQKKLIQSGYSISEFDIKQENIKIPYDIVASSTTKDSLIDFRGRPFFYGMYQAYADHRPFVLSPDIIWLLIAQGFAHHVNNNAEKLRSHFVDFNGKVSLVVQDDRIDLDNPNSPWEEVFPKFTEQIGQFAGKELTNLLTSDFSTTTTTSRIASQITIMEAMKSYFEYVVLYVGCGIPQITLEGTPKDWERVLQKTKQLRKYDFGWWIDEIEPLLQEFVQASKGNINKEFWKAMFKWHTLEKYLSPKLIDGWIVKFFPYNKYGNRNNLKELVGGGELPDEFVKVDLKYVKMDTGGNVVQEVPLELWSGFFGLQQNKENFMLKPEIGWMIRKKDISNSVIVEKLKKDNANDDSYGFGSGNGGIWLRVQSFPKELLQLPHIKRLEIEFLNKIDIPDEISEIKIDYLGLRGKISSEGIERLNKLLPDTRIIINGVDSRLDNKKMNTEKTTIGGLYLLQLEKSDTLKPVKE